jgi:gluconate kinase
LTRFDPPTCCLPACSTVASLLAERLGCPFYEGDSFHPVSNVTKMQAS